MTRLGLGEMRALYPILNEIDDESLSRLDSREWHRPSVEQQRQLDAVADGLGVYLMPYQVGFGPVEQGLCSLIAAAELDAGGIAAIGNVETAFPDIALVAYERPIRRRH